MGFTAITWTATPSPGDLVIARDVPLDNLAVLKAGPIKRGELLPGFTFNPWLGCQRISDACRHCYAEAWARRAGYVQGGSKRLPIWGPPTTTQRVRTSVANWRKPHRWNKIARDLDVRFKVFCASLADIGEDHPDVGAWRRAVFAMIAETPHLDWLLLTKRPAVLGAEWPREWTHEAPPHNVWVGATMENQQCAEQRASDLLAIPARHHFASVEPMVGHVDLEPWMGSRERALSWVIIGGESGGGFRELDMAAAESLAASCARHAVATFVKQDSGFNPGMRGRFSEKMWSLKAWPQ